MDGREEPPGSGSHQNEFRELTSKVKMSGDTSTFGQAARSTSPRLTRSQTSPAIATQLPTTSSPLASREGSPSRTLQTAAILGGNKAVRSRKNSTEQSPQRTPSHTPTAAQNTPSAAAVQRALAAVGNQKLPSPTASQPAAETSEPRKPSRSGSLPAVQSRLRSPPSTGRLQSPSSRNADHQQTPSVVLSHGGPKPSSGIETIQEEEDSSATEMDRSGRAGTKTVVPSESVQEDRTGLNHPGPSAQSKTTARPMTIQEDPEEDNSEMTSSQVTVGTKSSKATGESGSGSEETNSKKEKEKAVDSQQSAPASVVASRKPSITQLAPSKPGMLQARRSFQHLNSARTKAQSEGSVKSMTVETETVSNPDLLADDRDGRNASGRLDGTGSVRAKASTETIRPKKERKRVRKPANISSGTASSKADIFEQKVASAVDEAANSSDSGETFVYDSNPPEPRSSQRSQRGHRYHHSRTPSAASATSQSAENRSRGQHFGIASKKSMKFTNAHQLRDADDEDGASTYSSNTARSSHRPHHHIARLGRLQNMSQDSDSPVPSSARSPRARQFANWRGPASRGLQEQEQLVPSLADKTGPSNLYDLSAATEADGELTPLLMPVGRSSRGDGRRRSHRLPRIEAYQRTPLRACLRLVRYTFMTFAIVLALGVVIAGMVLCNRKLSDVHVKEVRNVLASEQELFVELEVHAINPNLVDISIAEANLDLFARSKYVGTTEMWRDGTIPGIDRSELKRNMSATEVGGGVDEGTDPIDEPGSGTHTMLLGRVHELESPLVFESSPFHHRYRRSTTGLRLAKPGNKTEEGGSRRWENVMQHRFELVVRGRLQYLLPLSSKEIYLTISGSTQVVPDKSPDDDDDDNDGNVGKGGSGNKNGTVGIDTKSRRHRQ